MQIFIPTLVPETGQSQNQESLADFYNQRCPIGKRSQSNYSSSNIFSSTHFCIIRRNFLSTAAILRYLLPVAHPLHSTPFYFFSSSSVPFTYQTFNSINCEQDCISKDAFPDSQTYRPSRSLLLPLSAQRVKSL